MRGLRRGPLVFVLVVCGLAAGAAPALASAETPAFLGAQQRFTLDSQALADRASVGVNVANGNLVVSAADVRIAGRGLNLSISRTYNGRGGGAVRTAGRDWVVSLGADNTLATEADGDRTWRGPSGEEYRFNKRTDGTFETASGSGADVANESGGTATLTFRKTGTVLAFSSASPGRLTKVTDRNGNHIDYAYGTNGVSSITDTQGRSITFTYWTSGDLKTIADSTGRTWNYAYDANRRLTSYTDPEGKVWGYHYDSAGRLDEITDPRLHKTLIGYDTTDRVTSVTRRVDGTTTNDVTTTYAYSAATAPCATTLAGKTVVTDPRGKATTYCVDANRQVVFARDAKNRDTSRTYTPNGDVSAFTEYDGTGAAAPTTYNFAITGGDPSNTLTSGVFGAGETFSLTYQGTSGLARYRVASFTDAQGSDTFYGYDGVGNLTSVKDDLTAPFNHVTLAYNTDGTLDTATALGPDGLPKLTDFAYHPNGNLASVTPPVTVGPGSAFGGTTYTYDALSRVKTVTDGRGEAQEFSYDKLDRVVRIDYGSPVGEHWVTYAYDGNGNVTAQDNDRSLNLAYTYDKLNRRTYDDLPATGYFNSYTYDKSSNLKTVTDQHQTVSYTYDDVDRVATITAPTADDSATETVSYGYDDNANPRSKTVTLPSGAKERTEYDLSGKTTKVVSTESSGTQTLRSREYSFTEGTAQRALVQSVTDENGVKTSYTYKDAVSGDTGRLVKAVTRDAANALIAQYDYVYDKAGNRKSVQASRVLIGDQSRGPDPDGNPAGEAQAFVTTALASGTSATLNVYLDAANTASSVKVGLYSSVNDAPGTLLGQATVTAPAAGAWNRVTFSGVAITEGTDYWIAILQPTGTTGTLKYRSHFEHGQGIEVSSQSTLSALPATWSARQVHGDDGPLSAYLTSTTQTTSFAYNNANQLCWSLAGSSSNGCGSPPAGATAYSYDAAGNQLLGDRQFTYGHLTQTATVSTGPSSSMPLEFLGADQNQLWSADGEIYQENLLGLSHEQAGERYVRDPDSGSVVSMAFDGESRYFLHDARDSTVALLHPEQRITRSYTYSPDGVGTNQGDGPVTGVQWNGALNVYDQGIYHFGARLYNPAIGRWTQPDPINQPADLTQANLYTYAGGDPINRVDPSGTHTAATITPQSFETDPDDFAAGNATLRRSYGACLRGSALSAARGSGYGAAAGCVYGMVRGRTFGEDVRQWTRPYWKPYL